MHALLAALAFLFTTLAGSAPTTTSVLAPFHNDVVVRLLACQYQSSCTVDGNGISICAMKWQCPRSIGS